VAAQFQNDSKLLYFQISGIREDKIININKYNSKNDFDKTNEW